MCSKEHIPVAGLTTAKPNSHRNRTVMHDMQRRFDSLFAMNTELYSQMHRTQPTISQHLIMFEQPFKTLNSLQNANFPQSSLSQDQTQNHSAYIPPVLDTRRRNITNSIHKNIDSQSATH